MDFPTFLRTGEIIVVDGAMGTQLGKLGVEMGGQCNLSHPDMVLQVHENYSRSGCHALITNTLTMNRIYIETRNLGIDVKKVNLTGAALARQAAGPGQYVLGNIGSTSKLLKPYGDLTEPDAYTAYTEQAALLAEGGVDGFLIETMMDLKEALCALRACRDVSDIPVIVSMAYKTPKNGGRTMMGNAAKDCTTALAEAGASAIGANCGDIDPLQMAEIVATIRATTALPVLAKPNAGKPRMVDREVVYDMSITEFLAGLRECINAGATLVGGCCGTSPEYIEALVHAVRKTP